MSSFGAGGGGEEWFDNFNTKEGKQYTITQQYFPKGKPYPWDNYPYDYWNIWVKHAGNEEFMEEPTLEMLIKEYNVIIFKHCFPGSSIKEDSGNPDISSEKKTIENYKLQYDAIKKKLHSFPDNKFIVWTNAALVKNQTDKESVKRARLFVDWVKNEWNEEDDNIFVWDFFELETEGGIYLKEEYAVGPDDSHPNKDFTEKAAPLFSRRIVDVIEGRGDSGSLTGE